MSSEEKTDSPSNGTFVGRAGRVPIAMMKRSAVMRSESPVRETCSSCGSMNSA